MLGKLMMMAGIGCCVAISVFLRVRIRINGRDRAESTIASPLSEAVSQTVGIAGGIYVALVLLFGFLEIEVPQRMQIATVTLNPMALCSIVLACAQPTVPLLWHGIKRLVHRE